MRAKLRWVWDGGFGRWHHEYESALLGLGSGRGPASGGLGIHWRPEDAS